LFFILKSELKGDQGKGLRIKIPIRTNKKLLYLIGYNETKKDYFREGIEG